MKSFKMNNGNKGSGYRDIFKKIIPLVGDYLSPAIGDAYLEWSYILPVFLIASTGKGKTTFFRDIIEKRRTINSMKKRKLKILVLTNRSANSIAFKKKIAKKLNRAILDEHSNLGINNLIEFDDDLYIMTYQQLLVLIDDMKSDFHKRHFDLVICHEIGFIQADSQLLNTGKIIQYIVSRFCDSVRCYASATPDPTFQYINNLEYYYFKKRKYNPTVFGASCHSCTITKLKAPILCDCRACYDKSRYGILDDLVCHDPDKEFFPLAYEMLKGYSYLRFHFINSYAEITNMIKDGKIKGKIIIFYDTKEHGREMENNLPNAIFIDAETKHIRSAKNKGKEAYDTIIDHETFNSDVLLASSAFDSGINLKYSSGIHNIVISTTDPNQFKQMLGRIRVNEGDIVDLFIVDICIEELKTRLKSIEDTLTAISNFALNERDFEDTYYNDSTSRYKFPIVQGVFYIINGQIVLNKAAETQLLYLKEILENIIAEYEQENKKTYVYNVLKWLGRENDYSEDKWVNYKTSADLYSEFIKYLNDLEHKRFDVKSEAYENLRFEFQTNFHKLVEGRNITVRKDDLWAPKGKGNDKLKEYSINFRFEKVDNYIELKKGTSY